MGVVFGTIGKNTKNDALSRRRGLKLNENEANKSIGPTVDCSGNSRDNFQSRDIVFQPKMAA